MKQLLQQYGSRAKGWFFSLSPAKRDASVFVATVLVCWLHLFIMSNIVGTFHHNVNGKYMSFSEDIVFHVYWLAITPFLITFLLRNRRSLQSLQDELVAKGISVQSVPTAKLFCWLLFLVVVGTAFFTPTIMASVDYGHWWEARFSGLYVFLHFLSCFVLASTTCLTCIFSAWRFAAGIRRQLAQSQRLVIEVYHTDGCGGLYWISRPFLNLTTALCVPVLLGGLVLVTRLCWDKGYSWQHPLVLFNIAWPMIFGPLVTFLVMQSTGIRKYLIEDRRRRLSMLSQAIAYELASVLPNEKACPSGKPA